MKIFISWSGSRSKTVADALKRWIKTVLQATEPWLSTRDIEGGSVWFSKIGEQLKDAKNGIICLTPENLKEPWILFEAGAIAKGLESNRVCTLLIGLDYADIKGPLAQFNHTELSKEGLRKLLEDFNKHLTPPLSETDFKTVFEALWPNLEPDIHAALAQQAEASPKRSAEDMTAEILQLTRSVHSLIQEQFVFTTPMPTWVRSRLQPQTFIPGSVDPVPGAYYVPSKLDYLAQPAKTSEINELFGDALTQKEGPQKSS